MLQWFQLFLFYETKPKLCNRSREDANLMIALCEKRKMKKVNKKQLKLTNLEQECFTLQERRKS